MYFYLYYCTVVKLAYVIYKSNYPFSMYVSGPSPFSELESQAIRDFTRSLLANNNLTAFYTLHAFGQQWAYAYSWSPDPVPEDAELVGTSRVTMVRYIKVGYLMSIW